MQYKPFRGHKTKKPSCC